MGSPAAGPTCSPGWGCGGGARPRGPAGLLRDRKRKPSRGPDLETPSGRRTCSSRSQTPAKTRNPRGVSLLGAAPPPPAPPPVCGAEDRQRPEGAAPWGAPEAGPRGRGSPGALPHWQGRQAARPAGARPARPGQARALAARVTGAASCGPAVPSLPWLRLVVIDAGAGPGPLPAPVTLG